MMPKLCLGTAQFGLPYGITNRVGQVAEPEVRELLKEAAASGIQWLDTAPSYGNAEYVLGHALCPGHSFQLISKLPAAVQTSFSASDRLRWEQSFFSSCERLGLDRLDALLLHQPSDLLKPGGDQLLDWLLSLRRRGLVSRLGISIYEAGDLQGIPPDLLDVVQLPLSLYDQRMLVDGTLARLRTRGTAIHARSIYLQGLLLSPANLWPVWVQPSVRQHHRRLEALAAERGCALIDLALGFAKAQSSLEAVVLGVCHREQLQSLLLSWTGINPWQPGEWQSWCINDSPILDPRCWPTS